MIESMKFAYKNNLRYTSIAGCVRHIKKTVYFINCDYIVQDKLSSAVKNTLSIISPKNIHNRAF